jgi:hypothetical protein
MYGLTVSNRDRPAVTSANVFHITRFDAASIDELGSSRRRTDGFPNFC